MTKRMEWVGFAFFVAVLVLGGLTGNVYVRQLLLRITDSVVLAAAWGLAARAGLVSLGHAAFWGLGAYTGALAVRWVPLDPPWAVLVGIAVAGVVALVTGAVVAALTVRMRVFYFAIATLALAELFRVVATGLPSVTGGSVGLFLPQGVFEASWAVWWTSILLAATSLLTLLMVQRSRLGYRLSLLGQDEMVAVMVGIRPLPLRILALALSAGLVGMKGATYGFHSGYLAPEVAFDASISVQAQILALAGGVQSAWGPVVGTLLLVPLGEGLRQAFGMRGFNLLVYGLLLVFLVLFLPRGIVGEMQRWAGGRLVPGAGVVNRARSRAAVETEGR